MKTSKKLGDHGTECKPWENNLMFKNKLPHWRGGGCRPK